MCACLHRSRGLQCKLFADLSALVSAAQKAPSFNITAVATGAVQQGEVQRLPVLAQSSMPMCRQLPTQVPGLSMSRKALPQHMGMPEVDTFLHVERYSIIAVAEHGHVDKRVVQVSKCGVG